MNGLFLAMVSGAMKWGGERRGGCQHQQLGGGLEADSLNSLVHSLVHSLVPSLADGCCW